MSSDSARVDSSHIRVCRDHEGDRALPVTVTVDSLDRSDKKTKINTTVKFLHMKYEMSCTRGRASLIIEELLSPSQLQTPLLTRAACVQHQ